MSSLQQVILLLVYFFIGAAAVRILGLPQQSAWWLRRACVAGGLLASAVLSKLDNNEDLVYGTKPLAVQVCIYAVLFGFILSWRLTPVGITGKCTFLCPFIPVPAREYYNCRGHCLRQINCIHCSTKGGLSRN
jgi:hypothetical protein